MTLRLLTYNIRHGGAGREEALAAVIRACAPDLVIFQEATEPGRSMRIARRTRGMAHCGAPPRPSLGFMSRTPVAHHAVAPAAPLAPRLPRDRAGRRPTARVRRAPERRARGVDRAAARDSSCARCCAAIAAAPAAASTCSPATSTRWRRASVSTSASCRRGCAPLVWLSGGRIRWRTIQIVLDAGYVDAFRRCIPTSRA